jgi:hypothetical protein
MSPSNLQPKVAHLSLARYRWLQLERGSERIGRERKLMPGLVIEREVVIEAPAEVVWRTITEPDQMSRWLADRVGLASGTRGVRR